VPKLKPKTSSYPAAFEDCDEKIKSSSFPVVCNWDNAQQEQSILVQKPKHKSCSYSEACKSEVFDEELETSIYPEACKSEVFDEEPETSIYPEAFKSEVCDEELETSSYPEPFKSEVFDEELETSSYPEPFKSEVCDEELETGSYPEAFQSEVCDEELETSSYPGAHNSMEVYDEEPENRSYSQDDPYYNTQMQSIHASKQRRKRICKQDNCPYCSAPPCGVCSQCRNPARKNRCLHRYIIIIM